MKRKSSVVDAITILAAWQPILKEIKCVEKFERTQAVSFKDGKLAIRAASNAVVSELKMCEQKILAAYATRFKNAVVQQLLIRRN